MNIVNWQVEQACRFRNLKNGI